MNRPAFLRVSAAAAKALSFGRAGARFSLLRAGGAQRDTDGGQHSVRAFRAQPADRQPCDDQHEQPDAVSVDDLSRFHTQRIITFFGAG